MATFEQYATVPYIPIEEEEEDRERWILHYSSSHQILLVGDGDFSFSLCLALAFGDASNIVATSLDSYDMLMKKYKEAPLNIQKLKSLGAHVLHGVDAIKMRLHTDLCMRKFDRIIFNFPHAGFYGKENNSKLIKMHRSIVQGFFRSASGMLRPFGEIHVSHKTTSPFLQWNLEELANECSLILIDCVGFKKDEYPGYNNKRGAGPRSDEPFPLKEFSTYKFTYLSMAKRLNIARRPPPQALDKYIIPVTFHFEDEISRIILDYFNHVIATYGKPSNDIICSSQKRLGIGIIRYIGEGPGRDLDGYRRLLHEIQLFLISRMQKLGVGLNSDNLLAFVIPFLPVFGILLVFEALCMVLQNTS